MKRLITWLCALLASIMLAVCLSACGFRHPLSPAVSTDHGSSPGDVLHRLALIATTLAGLAILVCGFAAIALPDFITKKVCIRIASGAAAVIALSQIIYWVGSHTWLLVLVLLGAAGIWVWLHLAVVERWLGKDLNGNGSIGK